MIDGFCFVGVHHTVSSVASKQVWAPGSGGHPEYMGALPGWMRERPEEPPWPSHWVGHTQLRTSESRYPPSDHDSYSFTYLAGRLAGFHTRGPSRFSLWYLFERLASGRPFDLSCGFGTPINEKKLGVSSVAWPFGRYMGDVRHCEMITGLGEC